MIGAAKAQLLNIRGDLSKIKQDIGTYLYFMNEIKR